jgi:hypothetical protein
MQETQEKWARILAQTWADEGFKPRLIADSKSVLKAMAAPGGFAS